MNVPLPGQEFAGRYRVERLLGEGGFGWVLLASDPVMQRSVAIKVLKPQAMPDAGRARARFEREARIVASLQCAHTVAAYDVGTVGDAPYVVFEYVRGDDLSAVLRQRGALTQDEAFHVLSQLLEALREAHGKGLLHRDLKPQNVRVFAYDGDPLRVKLLDFGLARVADDQHPSITATGEIIGTPRYMSPEQLYGRPLTAASDIYSLGLMAAELLLGEDALSSNVIGAQVERVVSGVQFDLASLDPATAELIRRMTATEPDERYQTAASAQRALAEIKSGSVKAAWREPKARRRFGFAGGALAGIGLSLAIFGAFWATRDEDGARYRDAQGIPGTALTQPHAPPDPVATPRDLGIRATDVAQPAPDLRPTGPCQRQPPHRGLDTIMLSSGVETVLAYVPETYVPGAPHAVVVYLHPIGQRPGDLFPTLGFQRVAENEGFIVLMPEDGVVDPWSDRQAAIRRVFHVLDDVATTMCIDRTKLYVVGHGRGGQLADAMSCRDEVRAFATYGYRPDVGYRPCSTEPKPFMLINPMKSKHYPVDGGLSCSGRTRVSLAEFESVWRDRNQCRDKSRVVARSRKSTCRRFECDAPLTVCRLDGGHAWPGSLQRERMFDMLQCDGPPTSFPKMAEEIWQFFESSSADDPRPR